MPGRESKNASYLRVLQHGQGHAPEDGETAARRMLRRRNVFLSIGVAVVIVILVTVVTAAVVVNVTSESFTMEAKCTKVDAGNSDYLVSKSINDFGRRLYNVLSAGKPENVIMSGYSLASVLSLALIGARDKSASELEKVLALPCSDDNSTDSPVALYYEGYKNAHQSLQENQAYVLENANRMFVDGQYALLADFQASATSYFSTVGGSTVDFVNDSEGARKSINDWVEQQTRNKIQEILPQGSVSSNTKLVLVNAIYLKANWTDQFEVMMTSEDSFKLQNGQEVQVPMMTVEADFAIGSVDGLKADLIRLPYIGDRLGMYVVLPHEGVAISDVESTLARMNDDVFNLADPPVYAKVRMPKFKLESSFKLKPALLSMGLKEIFSPGVANFSGISANIDDLYVDDVVQKAFVEVTEEGTEAAAATAMMFKNTAFREYTTEFIMNRPFLFFITDDETGLQLFSGKVMNPLDS